MLESELSYEYSYLVARSLLPILQATMMMTARLIRLKSPPGKNFSVLAKRQVKKPSKIRARKKAPKYPYMFFLNMKKEARKRSEPKTTPEIKEGLLPDLR